MKGLANQGTGINREVAACSMQAQGEGFDMSPMSPSFGADNYVHNCMVAAGYEGWLDDKRCQPDLDFDAVQQAVCYEPSGYVDRIAYRIQVAFEGNLEQGASIF